LRYLIHLGELALMINREVIDKIATKAKRRVSRPPTAPALIRTVLRRAV
jgi:hypothetical protein